MDYRLTPEDKERIKLLEQVRRKGLKELGAEKLRRLEELVEKKDYSHSGKAARSKKKLLKQINVAIYEVEK